MPVLESVQARVRKHRRLLIVVGLVVACAAKFVTGSLFVFNVYQDAIKDTFNYTQSQVEILSSMLNLGLGVGFLPGMFYDRFGPQWTSLLGLFVSVGAYLLIWSTTKSIEFYSNAPGIMAFYFFLCGLGSTFTYMVALNTNVINFDGKHTGKVIGLLNAFFAGSPSVFSVIYYHVLDQNFTDFMLLFAFSFGFVDILCIVFLRVYRDEDVEFVKFEDENQAEIEGDKVNEAPVETEVKTSVPGHNRRDITGDQNNDELGCFADHGTQTIRSYTNGDTEPNVDQNGDFSTTPLSLPKVLMKPDFHLFAWAFACASCIGLVSANNITVISNSVHLDNYDDRITLIIPIVNAINSALIGFLSDYFVDKIPRLVVLIGGFTFFLVSQILVILFADKLSLLELATMFTGLGISIIWTIAPTIMKEMFYIGNLGRNWGITILLGALLGFATQELFGALYDAQISTPGEIYCYGMGCIRGGTAVNIGLSSMAVVLGFVLQFKRLCIRGT